MPRRLPDGFGAWYDEKEGDTGDLWHRTLIDPGLFTRLGLLPKGTRVLDVGCGNGYIARRLARRGARVVGVDASKELIGAARRRERDEPLGITYVRANAAHLGMLADESFDVAVANMSILDIRNGEGAIREVGRLVVAGGRFVFSISHPCFDVDTRSTFEVSETPDGPEIYRKVTGYRQPHSDRFLWNLDGDRTVVTVGYHRPLAWYAHALRAAGWVIVDLEEPAPGPDYSGVRVRKEMLEEIPLHLVVEARREPRSTRPAGHARSPKRRARR